MTTKTVRTMVRVMIVMACVAAVGVPVAESKAMAQPDQASPADLRRENDQLRERVAAMQAQLAERNRRIKQLEDELKALKEQSKAAPASPDAAPGSTPARPTAPTGAPVAKPPAAPPTQAPTGPIAPLPEEALASPESMFAVLAKDYDEATQSLALGTDDERKRFIREASKWARGVERKHRGMVEWIIEVVSATDSGGRTTVEYRVVDPDSRLPYSALTQTMVLPSRTGKVLADRKDQKFWKLTGTFGAKPTINADRESSGFFDVPKLIGPFAEFGFDLTVTTLTPAPAAAAP